MKIWLGGNWGIGMVWIATGICGGGIGPEQEWSMAKADNDRDYLAARARIRGRATWWTRFNWAAVGRGGKADGKAA